MEQHWSPSLPASNYCFDIMLEQGCSTPYWSSAEDTMGGFNYSYTREWKLPSRTLHDQATFATDFAPERPILAPSRTWPLDQSHDNQSPGQSCEQWETTSVPSTGPSTPGSMAYLAQYFDHACLDPLHEPCYAEAIDTTELYNLPFPHQQDKSMAEPATRDQKAKAQRPSRPRQSRFTGKELAQYGRENSDGTWTCAFEGCQSQTKFRRSCDLRKHYKRHERQFFCQLPDCERSSDGGFSTKKDRLRHEARHNPNVHCEWPGCGRMFSRQDNMRDHVRRVHEKSRPNAIS